MRIKMGFSRMSQWMVLVLMPIYLVTGCGDLEPEMQDTRTVILKMDFDQRSSSRTSSFSHVDLSNYKTHLILALPSWEFLHSSYWTHSLERAGLMNTTDKKVRLEIPLYTQMSVYAFLFTGDYDDGLAGLFSAKPDVGLSGKSQSFKIDHGPGIIINGNRIDPPSLVITLCQNWSLGVCMDTFDDFGDDTTAPTVSLVYPNDNGVSITQNISVTFSEAMNTTTITTNISNTTCSGSFQLSTEYNNFSSCIQMSSSPISSNSHKTFTVDPSNNLSHFTNYKIIVTTGVRDTAGNSLSSQYISEFTTAFP